MVLTVHIIRTVHTVYTYRTYCTYCTHCTFCTYCTSCTYGGPLGSKLEVFWQVCVISACRVTFLSIQGEAEMGAEIQAEMGAEIGAEIFGMCAEIVPKYLGCVPK